MASGVVGVVGVGVVVVVVVVVGVCNRSQMRTSKCICLIFGVSIGLDLTRNAQKEGHTRHIADHLWIGWLLVNIPMQ